MMKTFLSLFLIIFLYFVNLTSTFAYQIPDFASCVNPQGNIIASYENGTHGIAGKTGSYEGKDVVYEMSAEAVNQCFCAVDEAGIQTNWWKISSLSESEIKSLQSKGWIYIPNGALWGLKDGPYLAKNSDFSCKSGSSSGSGSSNSSDSASSDPGSGSLTAISSGGIGQVLGLAPTGNSAFLLGTSMISGLSLLLGLIFKKRSKKFSK